MANNKYSRLKRNFLLLKTLKKASPNLRKHILKKCNDDLIKCLCDICYNICAGNCKLSPNQHRALIRHKNPIRDLANKKKSLKSKRRSMIQRGGFLPALLIPAISIISSIIGSLI